MEISQKFDAFLGSSAPALPRAMRFSAVLVYGLAAELFQARVPPGPYRPPARPPASAPRPAARTGRAVGGSGGVAVDPRLAVPARLAPQPRKPGRAAPSWVWPWVRTKEANELQLPVFVLKMNNVFTYVCLIMSFKFGNF